MILQNSSKGRNKENEIGNAFTGDRACDAGKMEIPGVTCYGECYDETEIYSRRKVISGTKVSSRLISGNIHDVTYIAIPRQ